MAAGFSRQQQYPNFGNRIIPGGYSIGSARTSGNAPPLPPQPSPSFPNLSGQGQSRAAGGYNFPLTSAAGLTSPVTSSSMNPEVNLDPSDFPALGSGSSSAATSGPNLISSYASQAGNFPNGAISAAGGNAPGLAQQPPANPGTREFSADDFPALGGQPPQHSQQQQQPQTQQPGGGMQGSQQPESSHLPPGINASAVGSQPNGVLNTGANANIGNHLQRPPTAGSQAQTDQANIAALHQQRQQALLGSIMGTGSNPQARASTVGFASEQDKRNFNKLAAISNPSWTPGSAPQFPLNGLVAPTSGQLPNGIPQTPSLQGAGIQPRPPSVPPHMAHLALQHSIPPPHQTPAQQVLYSPADRFGLLGLLNLIRHPDPEQAMLPLGNDLTKLGLDMAAPNNLHPSFLTPWSDTKDVVGLNIEPEFTLPACYNVQPPPAQSKAQHFSDETLFFIFYSQPRDLMQEIAAQELYKHNWRYHKELQLWLTKEQGTEPTQKTPSYERGTYIFFDPLAWEKVKKEFLLVYEHILTRTHSA